MNTLLVCSAVVLVGTAAYADPDHDTDALPAASTSRISANLGLWTPVGEVGFEYAYIAVPRLEISVGVGLGNVLDSVKPQVALMPRLRQRTRFGALTLGLGASYGIYHQAGFWSSTLQTTALWANGEGGIEFGSTKGWVARLFIGYGMIVAHSRVEVIFADGSDDSPDLVNGLPYGGVALGFAF